MVTLDLARKAAATRKGGFTTEAQVVRKNRFFLILIDPVQRCFFHSEKFTVRSGY